MEKIIYKCPECGSTDVEQLAWVAINENDRITDFCDHEGSYYCNSCNRNLNELTKD